LRKLLKSHFRCRQHRVLLADHYYDKKAKDVLFQNRLHAMFYIPRQYSLGLQAWTWA